MYKETFGTEWHDLDRNELVDRAFALGVAASLGENYPDELDRLLAETTGSYEESLIELAYEEGRTKARKHQRTEDVDDPEAVWESLIDAEERTSRDTDGPTVQTDLPTAISQVDFLDRTNPGESELEKLDLPEFLKR
ncbi:MAG: hypothetical protein SVG88_02090 [Halobacteriales archaeon]|nr:hypothetical protein [Halobacteriales archaeon]